MATESYRLSDGRITDSAAEFREDCMRLVNELIECGGQISIDKHDGKPEALLAAYGPLMPLPWGKYKGLEIADDFDGPLYTDEEVDAFLERELENIYGPRTDRAK